MTVGDLFDVTDPTFIADPYRHPQPLRGWNEYEYHPR